MTSSAARKPSTRNPIPAKAIDARRRDAAAKVTAVRKAINTVGRTGVAITRADIARLAGVSRSFTYQNQTAHTLIASAQARSRTQQSARVETITAQQEASWRERALNAEDQIRTLGRELGKHRQLVADLMGQLRDPDGTWLEQDRNRLRDENERLLTQRNQLLADQSELHRKLAGARANVTRLNGARVKELFPAGPSPDTAGYALPPAPTDT
jgi:small-conductance mechanosensitive channel